MKRFDSMQKYIDDLKSANELPHYGLKRNAIPVGSHLKVHTVRNAPVHENFIRRVPLKPKAWLCSRCGHKHPANMLVCQ